MFVNLINVFVLIKPTTLLKLFYGCYYDAVVHKKFKCFEKLITKKKSMKTTLLLVVKNNCQMKHNQTTIYKAFIIC